MRTLTVAELEVALARNLPVRYVEVPYDKNETGCRDLGLAKKIVDDYDIDTTFYKATDPVMDEYDSGTWYVEAVKGVVYGDAPPPMPKKPGLGEFQPWKDLVTARNLLRVAYQGDRWDLAPRLIGLLRTTADALEAKLRLETFR